MKVLDSRNGEIANLEIKVDGKTGACRPEIKAGGYVIGGPDLTVSMSKDPETSGLLVDLDLAGLTKLKVLVSKDDIKGMKGLMNKDALSFMIKALM